MKKSKYNSYYYWENLINKEEGIWENPFKDMLITQESKFSHYVAVNCYGESQDVWAYYPSVKALLGFLQYVYIPTAFNILLLDKNIEELAIPMCTAEELLEAASEGTKTVNKEYIPIMEQELMELKRLWQLDDEECYRGLQKFQVEFNSNWNSRNDIFCYFDIFESPIEVGRYIIESYENDEIVDLERIEEYLGVKKEEWLHICETLYDSDFMKRKFVEVLNNRIEDMI